MKTYWAIIPAAAVLLGMISTGGCVSMDKYKELLAANRRANEQLQQTKSALLECQAERDTLAGQVSDRDTQLKVKQNEIDLLDSNYKRLQKDFAKIEALYKKLLASEQPLPPSVPILPQPVDKALRALAKDNPELVEYLPRFGMVKFKSDFTFDKGSDDVAPGAIEALGKLVNILNAEAAAKFHVYVAGHTDDIPIKKASTRRRHPTNWYLSVHRAVEVQKVLVKGGLEPERIGVMGFGEYHPVAPNKPNKQGNPKNRRVEIWIVPPGRFLTEAVESAE